MGLHEEKVSRINKSKEAVASSTSYRVEILRMKLVEFVIDFFSWTMAIVNKMRIHDDKKEGVTIVEKILQSMTLKFDFVIYSIEEANDIEELSIDELQSSLLTNLLSVGQLQEKRYEICIKDKEKSGAFAASKNYKVLVEKEIGSLINVL
ncbi:hypothetical protein FEM48_Zijuj02G0123300 [Ziziphus jujuba var. spinosa]|uniref:Uncharacterized protein n=1 Tax=Ziziphus jujuba var. spinosa TaxID=714518 RepID=A0A978VVP6_ZIZJJ|nr:hypothetical protein FEM48_Zijuj02G0123300 [Ziziphus jujuba var. spinosa]